MVPAYISLASSLVIVFQSVFGFCLSKVLAHPDPVITHDSGVATPENGIRAPAHIDALGGPAIFAYRVARTLSVFALLVLSIAVLLSDLAKTQDQQLYLVLCLVYVR